ncbi:hypothetical protein M0R45_035893 [Rubus argutus]|uniref:Uncharacterized protein n=1 Tax=Rubus argutus TaxID=59490 RepID=A0AAW1VYP7_RUBAR
MHLLPSSSSRRSPKTKTHERDILTGMERTMEFGATTTDPLRLLPNRTHPTQRFHIEVILFMGRGSQAVTRHTGGAAELLGKLTAWDELGSKDWIEHGPGIELPAAGRSGIDFDSGDGD